MGLVDSIVEKFKDDKVTELCSTLTYYQDHNHWALYDAFKAKAPNVTILDPVDSVYTLLLNDTKSLSRFGDGEFSNAALCQAFSQSPNKDLGQRLRNILLNDNNENCYVAIAKSHIYKNLLWENAHLDNFVAKTYSKDYYRRKYYNLLRSDYIYLDSVLSIVKNHYPTAPDEFMHAYYDLVKLLFTDKDILLVTGDNRIGSLDHNILHESARTVKLLQVPVRNAFGHYDEIKNEILDINSNGNFLVVLSCGPTASVLAYDLSDRMRVLDIGHMPVDYNLAYGGRQVGEFFA